MMELWKNAPMWHAINVHLPLVLAMVGLPLVCILAITRGRNRAMRWGLVAFYAVLVLSALYAVYTGERAMDALSSGVSANAWKRVNLHEWMAKKVWILGAATMVCLLLVNIPRVWARQTFLVLALLASLTTTGWVIATGHFGGTAVYSYGVGTPGTQAGSESTPHTVVAKKSKKKKSTPSVAIAKAAPNVAAPNVVAPNVVPNPAQAKAAHPTNAVPSVNIVKVVSYEKDIKPIFVARCLECHEGPDAKSAYDISTVFLMTKNGRKAGPGVIPGDPAGSAIIQYINGKKQPQMPKGAKPLPAEQIQAITNWIAQGAVDDSQPLPATPGSPTPNPAKPLVVNGSQPSAASQPVASTQASPTTAAAAIDPSTFTGFTRVNKPERVFDADEHLETWNPKSVDWSVTDNAAVRRYLRLQQLPVVNAPKKNPKGAQNPIDAFVMPRWPADGNVPVVCDDSTYFRRVSIDILGLVPIERDVQRFVADTSKDKRVKLVDELLSRNEEYAANWVPWWEDALCSSGKHQGGVGTHGDYRDWLKTSFVKNKPFDTMVLELLDPEMPGHPDRYVLTKSHMVTVQSAADTAQIFLSTAIKCASCHSHFENAEWPQARAVAFASFFSPNDMEIIRCERKTGQFAPAAYPFELPGAPKTVPTDKNLRLRRVAQLTVDPANPRFANAIVNRLWKRYFGLGIFEPVDDFRADRPPANPELLAWLADDFMRSGYNIKHTIRTILTSRAYQLRYDPKLEDTFDIAKPTAPRLMRSPSLRRLTAEQLLDSIQVVMTQDRSLSAGRMYTVDESTELLRALGKSSTRNELSTGRSDEAAVVQALQLMNGPEYHDRIYKGDLVVALSAIEDSSKLVEKMYWSVLNRKPTPEELALGIKFLSAAPPKPTTAPTETVWIDDELPKGAAANGNWKFAAAPEHQVFSGKLSHVSASTGQSQHTFTGGKFTVTPTDKLFTYVYLDPVNPPKAVMLQFHSGPNWNHRGFWGDESIEFQPKKKFGDLPKVGGWVRLEVTARELGFGDPVNTIDGVSFDNFDGKCYWDKLGQVNTIPVHDTEIVGDMMWALMTSPEFQYIK